MAELALAIIPLGITVTSGLVKYLKAFNDHDDDRARLVRQAEGFASTFKSLESSLKRSQLNPELYISSSEASNCLRECQKALEELHIIQQKIFVTTTSGVVTTSPSRTKDKIKDGYKKLVYPLRKSDMENLDGALNKLSSALGLALGILHLDEGSLTRKALNEKMAEIQKSTIINSNTASAIKELRQPISRIDSAIPVIQTSVDHIVPHLDQRFDQMSQQYVQMQAEIKSFLSAASDTRYQNRLGINPQSSYNDFGEQDKFLAARETERELVTPAKRANLVSRCSCQLRRVRRSKGFALGPVHFAEEMLSTLCHEKNCVFFIPSSAYEKTQTIRFTGLASLLRKGVAVSFSTCARAGGFSISPSFSYFPVVDQKVAPAFLVMDILRSASRLRNIDETRCRTILSTAQQKLQELFCSGRASPNDVTQNGSTLLHALSSTVHLWSGTLQRADSPFLRLTCEGLVNLLVITGTSITVRDRSGRLAWHEMIDGTFVPASIYDRLLAGNDVEDRSNGYIPSSPNRLERLNYHEHNQNVAKIQYGPLSLAVIRNNLLEVERLIAQHPNMLEEISFYGETPLHLAIDRLDILKVLAEKANPELWIKLTHSFATVLGLAIQVSAEICNAEKNSDESSCPCTLPLQIILAAGCPIIPHRDFRRGSRPDISDGSFYDASPHCKRLLAKELRNRRQQLRDLAQKKLSITELSNFTPLEEVLDVDAIEIDRLLRQRGVLDLGPLSTFVDRDLPERLDRDVGHYSRSIFFDLTAPQDADLFVDYGFKIACADEDHNSSLNRILCDGTMRRIRSIPLDYAKWLFDHQAPLWKWSYRFTSPMPSIFVLADILGMQDYKCPDRAKISDAVENCLSASVLVDNCSCLCSPDGCTPFASRMKWLAHSIDDVEELTPQDYAMRFSSYVETYGRSMSLSHHVIMVRQATFTALNLKHTCLDRPGYSCWLGYANPMCFLNRVTELEPDEKEFEILNADVDAVSQMEKGVFMFQNFVLTGHQTAISSKVDSCDIDYSVFDEPSALGIDDFYHQRVLEFWQQIWVNWIQDALDALAKRWDNKLDGMNDLAQISTCEQAVQETSDSLKMGDDEIFNRIIQRIQDIERLL